MGEKDIWFRFVLDDFFFFFFLLCFFVFGLG